MTKYLISDERTEENSDSDSGYFWGDAADLRREANAAADKEKMQSSSTTAMIKKKAWLSSIFSDQPTMDKENQNPAAAEKEATKTVGGKVKSQLVQDRLQWMQTHLLADPKSQQNTTTTITTGMTRSKRESDLVAQRRRLLEERGGEPTGEERRPFPHSVSSDLVSERARMLEAQQALSDQQHPQRSTSHTSSDLVSERRRLLEGKQSLSKEELLAPSNTTAVVSSDLVAERSRCLKERCTQSSASSQSQKRVMGASLFKGLASNGSKWLQSLTTQPQSEQGRQSTTTRIQPGKLSKEKEFWSTSNNNAAQQSRNNIQPAAAVFGRIDEKREQILSKFQSNGTAPPVQFRPVRKWGEPHMPYVDQLALETGFLEHVTIEIEQEGLLPGFLAEPAAWLFSALVGKNHDDNEDSKSHSTVTSSMDMLRLDYCEPVDSEKPSEETNIPTTQSAPESQPSNDQPEKDSKSDEVTCCPPPSTEISETVQEEEEEEEEDMELEIKSTESTYNEEDLPENTDVWVTPPESKMTYEECNAMIFCSRPIHRYWKSNLCC